jgi:XTP/dITP diphosphohydrolase
LTRPGPPSKKEAVILATQNKDKLRELQHLMGGSQVKVLSLADFGKLPKVREDAPTFEGNAEKKARVYSKKTKALVIADDSGLMVHALGGAPGVYSARYAGPGCSYTDNNVKLLNALRSTAWPKRTAKFVSVISVYDNGKKIGTVRGECVGRIGFIEKGDNGFGYDPVFIPKGIGKTYAELTAEQKGKLSHRGKALRKARRLLLNYLRLKR